MAIGLGSPRELDGIATADSLAANFPVCMFLQQRFQAAPNHIVIIGQQDPDHRVPPR